MPLVRLVLVAVGLLLPLGAAPAAAATSGWGWPVEPPEVVRGFQPPSDPYGPGHRGVDLAGEVGQDVRSAGAGRVVFAGQVGGIGTVSVDHGAIRTTYQPLDVLVVAGLQVQRGDILGTLRLEGGHCSPAACLHWGARTGDVYLDPLGLLNPVPSRLLPYLDDPDFREADQDPGHSSGDAAETQNASGRAEAGPIVTATSGSGRGDGAGSTLPGQEIALTTAALLGTVGLALVRRRRR